MEYNRHEYYCDSYNDDFKEDEIRESKVGSLEKGTDELLIDAIRGYPHLYNSSLKQYKDVLMKENSWSEIAKVMDMSVASCQNRWLRLRERFSKEQRLREMETRSGSGATHRSAFPLYHNLLFLENHIKRRKSYTNMTNPTAKKQLIDISNISSLPDRINISTSNISSHQSISSTDTENSFPNSFSSILSKHSKVPNTNLNSENLLHLYPDDTSIQSGTASFINFTPIHPNIQKNNTQQTKDVTEPDRLFSPPPRCEPHSFSGMSEATSISRDSTPSPALQTLPVNIKIDRSSRMKSKSNTYLEHSLAALSDSLQKRMANEPSQQMSWNLNDLTPDKSFGLLVATELQRIPEPEKSKRKQAIVDILWKPLTR